jgi:hypothetical protein
MRPSLILILQNFKTSFSFPTKAQSILEKNTHINRLKETNPPRKNQEILILLPVPVPLTRFPATFLDTINLIPLRKTNLPKSTFQTPLGKTLSTPSISLIFPPVEKNQQKSKQEKDPRNIRQQCSTQKVHNLLKKDKLSLTQHYVYINSLL